MLLQAHWKSAVAVYQETDCKQTHFCVREVARQHLSFAEPVKVLQELPQPAAEFHSSRPASGSHQENKRMGDNW